MVPVQKVKPGSVVWFNAPMVLNGKLVSVAVCEIRVRRSDARFAPRIP